MHQLSPAHRWALLALSALAITTGCLNARQARAEELPKFIQTIEQKGFSGSLFNTGFGVGDVKFRPDGTFTGKLYWRAPRGNIAIKGSLQGWTIIIDEVAQAGRNRTPFGTPCRIKAEIGPGTASARGTVSNCEMTERGPTVRLTFKSPSPSDPVADAAADAARKQKETEAAAREADKPRTEAIFAVASASFVQQRCPALSVNGPQLSEVLQTRGMTAEQAQLSADYTKYLEDWNSSLKQHGADRLCREFQLTFASPTMPRDMIRLIALDGVPPQLPSP